jgi:helicase
VLGAISSGFAPDTRALLDFFGSTFYAHQYGDISRIQSIIFEVLGELRAWGFVEKEKGAPASGFAELGKLLKKEAEPIVLTKLGRRVAELYIDPLTAHDIIDLMSSAEGAEPFAYLTMISNTFEMRPGPSVRAKEEESIWAEGHRRKLLGKVPEPWDLEGDNFMRALKLATALDSWISEVPDSEIMDKLNIAPGDLRTKLANADWVCYAASELARLEGKKKMTSDLLKLQIRLEHGIREELLPLIGLRGIGRVRARKLFSAGLKNPEVVLNTDRKKLAALIGEKLAEKLLARNR